MYAKILKWIEAVVMAISVTAALVVLLMLIRYLGQPLWTQEASGWAQAVGSVVAILASFFLFSRQREHEQQEGRDNELARRTKAVAAVQDVAYWALAAMDECVEHKKGMRGIRPESDLVQRLDELRELLNRFVEPATDRVIVLAAMFIGNALLQTKNDLPYPFMDRDDEGIARMTARNDELRLTHERLLRMQRAFEQKCAARGIEVDPPETWIDG